MARRRAQDQETEQETEQDADREGRQMRYPAKKLKALTNAARSAKKDISEISGGFGEQVKTAVEQGLHRKAWRVVCQLDNMEPEKLGDWFEAFDQYVADLKLRERASTAPRMRFEEDEVGDDGKVVRPFPQPHGIAAE